MPAVAVVCGSRSDLSTLKGCFDVLDSYGIGWEASFISAHRQADALHAYVAEAEASGVRLFIGEESGFAPLGPCSVITAPYGDRSRTLGVIAVIGPTRMDYDRVIPVVQTTAQVLSNTLKTSGLAP